MNELLSKIVDESIDLRLSELLNFFSYTSAQLFGSHERYDDWKPAFSHATFKWFGPLDVAA